MSTPPPCPSSSPSSSDASVILSNLSAFQSKLLSMRAGYFHSPTLHLLSTHLPTPSSPISSSVVMNRGTWARVTLKRTLIRSFLRTFSSLPCQIISLGGGFDFHGLELMRSSHPFNVTRYVELDLGPVIRQKQAALDDGAAFDLHKTETRATGARFRGVGGEYVLIEGDLRENWRARLTEWGVKASGCTLVVAEIVLVYLDRKIGDAVVRECREWVGEGGMVVMEHVGREDGFGEEMRRNLERGGWRLTGMLKGETEWEQRMRTAGWCEMEIEDMWKMWGRCVGEVGRRAGRVDGVKEMLDEVEEIRLLMSHYVVIMATTQHIAKWIQNTFTH